MKYTFKSQHLSEDWVTSSRRFDTEGEAIKAALEWAETCLWNGVTVGIGIITVKE